MTKINSCAKPGDLTDFRALGTIRGMITLYGYRLGTEGVQQRAAAERMRLVKASATQLEGRPGAGRVKSTPR